MSSPQYIPSFYFYKFAQGLSAPYTSFEAYKSGSIDASGNFIRPESSIDPLEYLIIKLKRIFEELPAGMTKAKLGNYMSTLQLFGEEANQFGITDGEYSGLMEGHLALNGYPEVSYFQLNEDMSVGGMAAPASSPGYNVGGVSGNDPPMAPMQRRGPVLKGLDKCSMFDVCPEELKQFQSAEDWRGLPESDTKKYVRRFGLRNPEGYIALRSVDPDTNKANIHWINFKQKSLKEDTDILFEAKKKTIVPVLAPSADTYEKIFSETESRLRETGALENIKGRTAKEKKFSPEAAEAWLHPHVLFNSSQFLRHGNPEEVGKYLERYSNTLIKPSSSKEKVDVAAPYGSGYDVKSGRATMGIRFANLFQNGLGLPPEATEYIDKSRSLSVKRKEAEEEAQAQNMPAEKHKGWKEIAAERELLGKNFKDWLRSDPIGTRWHQELQRQWIPHTISPNIRHGLVSYPDINPRILKPAEWADILRKEQLKLEPTRSSGQGAVEGQVQLEREPFASRRYLRNLSTGREIKMSPPEVDPNLQYVLGKNSNAMRSAMNIYNIMFPKK